MKIIVLGKSMRIGLIVLLISVQVHSMENTVTATSQTLRYVLTVAGGVFCVGFIAAGLLKRKMATERMLSPRNTFDRQTQTDTMLLVNMQTQTDPMLPMAVVDPHEKHYWLAKEYYTLLTNSTKESDFVESTRKLLKNHNEKDGIAQEINWELRDAFLYSIEYAKKEKEACGSVEDSIYQRWKIVEEKLETDHDRNNSSDDDEG